MLENILSIINDILVDIEITIDDQELIEATFEELGVEEIEVWELLFYCEEEFGIEIPYDDINSLQQLHEYIENNKDV
jgi:acyl carrier protein